MHRRDISKLLLAGSVGASAIPQLAQAQTCTAPCYARTPAEITAGVTPVDTSREPGDVRRYGAIGDGNASHTAVNTTAFASARAVAAATAPAPLRIFFPAGIYYYSASPNWAMDNITLEAVGLVQLNFTGTGNAWIFDAGANNLYNGRMIGNFTISGTSATTNGLYIVGMHQSRFEARVGNLTQAGCDINFCVSTSFRIQTTYDINPTRSYPASAIPSRGLYIKGRNAGEYTAWCQFHETVAEGVSNFGIDILYASGCSFFGGVVEDCGGGIRVDSTNYCQNNSFYSIDMEANRIYDVVLYGHHNRLVGCTAFSNAQNNNLEIGTGATGTQIIGGFYTQGDLQAGSNLSLFLNVSFANAGPGLMGPGTYRMTGCYLVDANGTYVSTMPDIIGGAVQMLYLPTSPTGLHTGSLWNSGGFVKVV